MEAADDASVLVSIASYRDPQLVPTVLDCLAKARRPERLRFAICWQHGEDEVLPDWFAGERFSLLDVDWRESRGACWARAEIMRLWRGEKWYLQLDSHMRFAADWDVRLLEQVALTRSSRPILSAFPPNFTLDGDAAPAPLLTTFDRFDEDGIALPGAGMVPGLEPGPAATPHALLVGCLPACAGIVCRGRPLRPGALFPWRGDDADTARCQPRLRAVSAV